MNQQLEDGFIDGEPFGLRDRWCGSLDAGDEGKAVTLCGWVAKVRTHGEHLRFVDLRDRSGMTQCVVDAKVDLRAEFVVAVKGIVRLRPSGTVNSTLPTGEVELADCSVQVLSEAEAPPFQLDSRAEVEEVTRLRYRYVDIRTERMARNLRLRAKIMSSIRSSMDAQGFVEVETPLLWTPTPEGAREFAVPSRLQKGSFYVLPQSPQIAKQLLMLGGLDRYYQIARCMRDEDLRADRQFEFTQLDLEASFVGQQEVMDVVSHAVRNAAHDATGLMPPTIERMTWDHALENYGSDKPDLRFGMKLIDMSQLFAETAVTAFRAACVKAIVLEGGADYSRAQLDSLVDRAKALGGKGLAWFKVKGNNPERNLESPLAKHLSEGETTAVLDQTKAQAGDLILVVADEATVVNQILGQIRLDLGRPGVPKGESHYVWITDFPLFEGLDPQGKPISAHHPFTMPNEQDMDLLESDPLNVRSQSYDLVLNGWELGSGSMRIHTQAVQERVFSALQLSEEQAQERFGFLLQAFRFGAPPHGGFGLGLDRLVAILAGEENIREVIAFPKTQSGSDPMTGAPKALDSSALAELGLTVRQAR